MKDIFSNLKNFLSEPTSTMALIGTFVVFISSSFIVPDRFCLVMTSFLAFFAVIAMRTIEMRLTKRLEDRNDVIQDLRAELHDLEQENNGIAAVCKKRRDEYSDLLDKYDERVKDIVRLEAELKEARKSREKEDVVTGPNTVLEAAQPAKKPQSVTTRKKREEYSEQDVVRIQNEMKSAGLVPEKED